MNKLYFPLSLLSLFIWAFISCVENVGSGSSTILESSCFQYPTIEEVQEIVDGGTPREYTRTCTVREVGNLGLYYTCIESGEQNITQIYYPSINNLLKQYNNLGILFADVKVIFSGNVSMIVQEIEYDFDDETMLETIEITTGNSSLSLNVMETDDQGRPQELMLELEGCSTSIGIRTYEYLDNTSQVILEDMFDSSVQNCITSADTTLELFDKEIVYTYDTNNNLNLEEVTTETSNIRKEYLIQSTEEYCLVDI